MCQKAASSIAASIFDLFCSALLVCRIFLLVLNRHLSILTAHATPLSNTLKIGLIPKHPQARRPLINPVI